MGKKKVPILLGIFFLVQVTSSYSLSTETYPLNPQTKVSQHEANVPFQQVHDTVYLALAIYKADAINGESREEIARRFGAALFGRTVQFDFNLMDLGKKGWTRYYPIYIADKPFIVRVFLTDEYAYQPKVPVLFEAAMTNPAVTIQVLPGVNSILKDCRIKPYRIYSDSETGRSI